MRSRVTWSFSSLHPFNLSIYFHLVKLQCLLFFEQDINFYFAFCFLLTNQVKVKQHVVDLQLQPLNIVLRKTLDLLQTKDPGEIFAEPVDTDEVGKRKQWLTDTCLHRIIFSVEASNSRKYVCICRLAFNSLFKNRIINTLNCQRINS